MDEAFSADLFLLTLSCTRCTVMASAYLFSCSIRPQAVLIGHPVLNFYKFSALHPIPASVDFSIFSNLQVCTAVLSRENTFYELRVKNLISLEMVAQNKVSYFKGELDGGHYKQMKSNIKFNQKSNWVWWKSGLCLLPYFKHRYKVTMTRYNSDHNIIMYCTNHWVCL